MLVLVADSAPSSPSVASTPRSGWQVVALLITGSRSIAPCLGGAQVALGLAQELVSRSRPPRMLLLTCSTQAPSADAAHAASDAAQGGVWGLARVLRLEHTGLSTQSVDM